MVSGCGKLSMDDMQTPSGLCMTPLAAQQCTRLRDEQGARAPPTAAPMRRPGPALHGPTFGTSSSSTIHMVRHSSLAFATWKAGQQLKQLLNAAWDAGL